MSGLVCEHCEAPIQWLTTSAGKQMPVNAAPDPERGNVVLLGARAGVLGAGQAAAARARGVQVFLHHAVTCPFAHRWQRR